ncbi:MAG: hypothetical protein HQ453_13315 [Actinobacteria bacterium]|nr:hypothetical protein [Actinomycetota bacterium]
MRALFQVAAIFLGFSVIQVIANVISMLNTAHVQQGTGLSSLRDVMSRVTKLVMSLQVLLAILMLTVLISRAVAATS